MPIPRALKERLRSGRVVPFVGAGVSMAVLDRHTHRSLFPSWSQLLSAASDRLNEEAKPDVANVVSAILQLPKPDFLYAATQARDALGPIWYELLKDKLDISFERVDTSTLELARSIWRLGSNLIITSNYDEVLKWACLLPTDLQSWDIKAPVEQASLLQRELARPVVWHLHGRISNASQMILVNDDYKLLYPESNQSGRETQYQSALEVLRHQIAANSLLFIGFSLDDEYLGMQLKSIDRIFEGAAGPHFALVREGDRDRVQKSHTGVELLTFSDFGQPLLELLGDLAAFGETDQPSAINVGAGAATEKNVPDYDPQRPVFYVPFRQKGDEIVGQQQALEDVRKQLTEGKRTAIGQTAAFRGLGGLGKTQLAVEYAYRYRNEYPNGVIWINADQDIDAQLIEIAQKARWIAPESDHKYKLEIALQRIRSYSDCLLIFDNLDDRRDIDAYLPEPEANPHIWSQVGSIMRTSSQYH